MGTLRPKYLLYGYMEPFGNASGGSMRDKFAL